MISPDRCIFPKGNFYFFVSQTVAYSLYFIAFFFFFRKRVHRDPFEKLKFFKGTCSKSNPSQEEDYVVVFHRNSVRLHEYKRIFFPNIFENASQKRKKRYFWFSILVYGFFWKGTRLGNSFDFKKKKTLLHSQITERSSPENIIDIVHHWRPQNRKIRFLLYAGFGIGRGYI